MALFSTLQDNFDDNSINGTLWYTYGLGVSEASGTSRFATQTTAQYSGWGSNSAYDLTGSYVEIEFVDAGSRSITSLEIQPIQLIKDANNTIDFFLGSGTTILARKKVAGVRTTVASETYSSTDHRFLRIRESGGTIYWDKAATGGAWVNIGSVANPFAITSLTSEYVVGTYSNEASTTTVIFDNFNIVRSSPSASASPMNNETTDRTMLDANQDKPRIVYRGSVVASLNTSAYTFTEWIGIVTLNNIKADANTLVEVYVKDHQTNRVYSLPFVTGNSSGQFALNGYYILTSVLEPSGVNAQKLQMYISKRAGATNEVYTFYYVVYSTKITEDVLF